MKSAWMLLALTVGGCAGTFDLAYLAGDGHYTETESASDDTGETTERQVVELAATGPQSYGLVCKRQTVPVVRKGQVEKRYRRQGGYGPGMYKGTAFVDGFFGALVGGAALGICLNNEDVSCLHTLWAAPFAIDLGYALLRGRAVREPVMIDKSYSDRGLGLAEAPSEEVEIDCQVSEVVAATMVRGTRESVTDDWDVILADDAVAMPVANQQLTVTTEALRVLVGSRSAQLWARGSDGQLRKIGMERCELLRRHGTDLGLTSSELHQSSCKSSGSQTTASRK